MARQDLCPLHPACARPPRTSGQKLTANAVSVSGRYEQRAMHGDSETGEAEVLRQDRERDSGYVPGSDMAHCDAAGVNGSNRILSHGAPPLRMMPTGCLGSPVLVLLRS